MPSTFIGIPTWNRPDLMRETLDSVLSQTCQDFTVVVSDNHSRDELADSVADYIKALKDPRIIFRRQPINGGEYGQGRYFFREAAGHKFFMILHDDDVLKPTYLEKAADALRTHPTLAYFAANPFIMDAAGARLPAETSEYLGLHGRIARQDGEIDVLETLFFHDFAPISATFFRLNALQDSGFVDDWCFGLYPFEPNIFLRLGDRGAKAWFCSEELFAIRFHGRSIRSRLDILENIQVLDTWIGLLDKRRYSGAVERQRRRFLGRSHRARALYYLRSGDAAAARREMQVALKKGFSFRTALIAPFVFCVPQISKGFFGSPHEQYSEEELAGYRQGASGSGAA